MCSFCNGYRKTVVGKGAVYFNKRKLKIHNITYDIIAVQVNNYLDENGIELAENDTPLLSK